MIGVSILIGVTGFSAMTWLFPALGKLWILLRPTGPMSCAKTLVKRFVVVIPAHNEERTLVKTLPSMLAAIKFLQISHPEIQVDIRIGADGCIDRTVEICKSFGADVVESPVPRGKWRTVHELIRSSTQADWIILSDAGILWPENFFAGCLPHCEMPDVVGVAPTYRNPTAGLVETLIWNLEAGLKTMENAAGGPVSVHGPTVMYRRNELLAAFDALSASGTKWINDDVAITLYLRLTRPQSKVVYIPTIASWDCAESHLEASGAPIREYNRRKRMVIGNLQWLKQILLPRWRENPIAAWITLRRIFRVLWAYWIAAFVVATAFIIGPEIFLFFAVVGATAGLLVIGVRPLLMLADSGWVSLLAPYYLLSGQGLSKWK